MTNSLRVSVALLALCTTAAFAGNFSLALNDPTNGHDAPVPGFIGPDGEGKARLLEFGGSFSNPNNFVNPLFFGWASGFVNYLPAPGVAPVWQNAVNSLGPVTGDNIDIVSLGDLSATQLSNGTLAGRISLTFSEPIRNKTGADFSVFENGFISFFGSGGFFAELAFVEVSSNGIHFARMPSRSLTAALSQGFGTVDPTDIFGLAGKHANAYGESWGTPFDLAWLANDPLVTGGQVNLNAITHIRLVDIPGNGSFLDSLGSPIYDAWVTTGSGGLDLEAVGVISQNTDFETWQTHLGLVGGERGANEDPDGDGIPNLFEYAAGLLPRSPDPTNAHQWLGYEEGRLILNFRRDERAVDLVLEVEASSDLVEWQIIARSTSGSPLQAVAPHGPLITEVSASHIASVGVIRRSIVSDELTNAQRRFLRLRARLLP